MHAVKQAGQEQDGSVYSATADGEQAKLAPSQTSAKNKKEEDGEVDS